MSSSELDEHCDFVTVHSQASSTNPTVVTKRQFKDLPTEVRWTIWDYAASSTNEIVRIQRQPDGDLDRPRISGVSRKVPFVALVNHESLEQYRKYFRAWQKQYTKDAQYRLCRGLDKTVYFDHSKDTVCFESVAIALNYFHFRACVELGFDLGFDPEACENDAFASGCTVAVPILSQDDDARQSFRTLTKSLMYYNVKNYIFTSGCELNDRLYADIFYDVFCKLRVSEIRVRPNVSFLPLEKFNATTGMALSPPEI